MGSIICYTKGCRVGIKRCSVHVRELWIKSYSSRKRESYLPVIAGRHNIYKRTNNKYSIELMALLKNILNSVKIISTTGNTVEEVKDLQIDSRKVTAGSCFIAIKGSAADGHNYIDTAITNGAAVIVCENIPSQIKDGVMYVEVENSAKAAGIMAHNFYGQASEKIKLVGVTGTNGKTTVATLLFK